MKLYGENDGRVGLSMSYLARAKCAKGEFNDFLLLVINVSFSLLFLASHIMFSLSMVVIT